MGITKRLNWQNIFIFLFLIAFPFGQVIKIGILQPIDLVVGLAAIWMIVKRLEIPKVYKHIGIFISFAAFSWFFSIFIFRQVEVVYGLLYLFRIAAYYFFGVYSWNFVSQKTDNRKLLLDSLLAMSVVSSLFGWVQFFMVPDIKALFVYGWDIHLFRLIGTFLDPTFLGLIIVFGILTSITRMIDDKNRRYLGTALFLLTSLAFTYSRASYLALFAGLIVIAAYKKVIKKAILFIVIFAAFLFLLPTSKNRSVELFRTFSAIAKVDNYKTTLQIFSKSPVFGIGYNNMCLAYQKYIGPQDFTSHSCSGSDSSLLLILTTTGVAGLIVFTFAIGRVIKSLRAKSSFIILSSSVAALLVHSLFSNSMFYPWVMGYLTILLAITARE
jgi:hypothetical protein